MAQSSLPALVARVSCSRGNTTLAALRLGGHRRDSTSGKRKGAVTRKPPRGAPSRKSPLLHSSRRAGLRR